MDTFPLYRAKILPALKLSIGKRWSLSSQSKILKSWLMEVPMKDSCAQDGFHLETTDWSYFFERRTFKRFPQGSKTLLREDLLNFPKGNRFFWGFSKVNELKNVSKDKYNFEGPLWRKYHSSDFYRLKIWHGSSEIWDTLKGSIWGLPFREDLLALFSRKKACLPCN